MHICACTNCGKIYVDKNIQPDTISYSETLFKYLDIEALEFRAYNNGIWVCPTCNTDAHLTDDLTITINRNYSTKIVEAAKKLDILIKEEAEDYENIRILLSNKHYHKDIHQFIEAREVDTPKGLHLSHTQQEKISNYFNNNYSTCRDLSRDGKLYFCYLDDEDNKGENGKIRTWGYITEAQINDILKPKPKKEEPKKNLAKENLTWYKKLMKNIS